MNRQYNQADKQQFYIIVMTLCFVIAIAVTYGSFISLAKSNQSEDQVIKYYTSIQIQSGDTLWEVASAYITAEYESISDYIKEVKHLNSLDDDKIHEGQYLTVPYYSTTLK
ncbi:cell division suppressor protein YneA [Candidatus Galacturonibacter soehngenii]|uniref:LysM peptidoglycan-binding domain-containing protein n=1 Tax=Candidatus Galacturonatibacter soehngenii TaxID=2307010 RepID=A0A7V7QM06_9FIRM|nr:LysM peptidoglycan-binding domain-containing protein [Candidatus Galacturonibacter soehngenii]KAB1439649.1 LysM peptidoglycan-binding domain-containing protein [Candidatus Galacturonibacter soehngenii]MBA4688024.1 LysM peptidoglycan-binding domain-containing protein [Candidatus Galacturonibacter soehngenii]